MKIYSKIALVLALALSLSACNMSKPMTKESMTNTDKNEQQMVADMSPTPTLSEDSSLDSIEAELKSTTILEEDFSDIQ